MRLHFNILLFLTIFLLVGISGANASISHSHHEGISGSPFQAGSTSHSLNCKLNGHHPVNKICPHAPLGASKNQVRIAVDCGGNPDGSIPAPQSSGNSHFLFSLNSFFSIMDSAQNMFVSSGFFQNFFPDPIDHPPRSW